MTDALYEELSTYPGVRVRRDEPLARHTPLRVGGPAELWAVVETPEAMASTLAAARRNKVSWRVHWPLAEWLVRDGGVKGLVLRPGRDFERVWRDGDRVWMGAAALWSSLSGLDTGPALASLSRWSGSVGGLLERPDRDRLVGMVAALRWTNGRKVEQVEVAPGEPLPEWPKSAVLVAVALRTEPAMGKLRRRFQADPPPAAGALLSATDGLPVGDVLNATGLLGARLRHWRLSAVEPGTVVHLGGGNCKDVLLLANGLIERAHRERGVALNTRLPIMGTESAA